MKKINKRAAADIAMRTIFFFAFPAVWIAGFGGVKNLCEQIHSGEPLEMNTFLLVLILLIGFTVVFGRFFCGKACAFGTYGDVLYWIAGKLFRRKRKAGGALPESAAEKLRYLKYAVLLCVCALCVLGYSSAVTKVSPWSAFSYITSLKFGFDSRADQLSLILFILCSAAMMIEKRFFCRFLCPMGAVFSLVPVIPFSMAKREKEKCIKGCRACKNNCPAQLDLPYSMKDKTSDPDTVPAEKGVITKEENYAFRMGECFECGKCADICPRKNAGCAAMPGGTKGIVYDLMKGAVLALLIWYFI